MINIEIHEIGMFADRAFDENDVKTLYNISITCLEWSELDKYNTLEKGILAYHGATACSNYIDLKYNGLLNYSIDGNEKDFELCLLLFRRCIYCFNTCRESNFEILSEEERYYLKEYINRAKTNYSLVLRKIGRFIKGISVLQVGVNEGFAMAIGTYATTLLNYGSFDYDRGHTDYFTHISYRHLKNIVENKYDLEKGAIHYFGEIKQDIEKVYLKEYLNEEFEFEDFSLGEDVSEQVYREWCLKEKLFLNTMNDVTCHSVAAHDILHLPNIVTSIEDGPRFHGLFNQIKQEFVSARYMLYEAINKNEPHFSDKEVHLVNTLDYPIYGISIEKMKFSYRSLYSIFDRISFLIHEYFDLGIDEREISYRSIWRKRQGRGKKSYETKIDLKEKMTNPKSYNLPLIGLYWLFKDIAKQKVEHHYINPDIEILATIRQHLEHKYLKIHDSYLYTMIKGKDRYDPVAFSISFDEFRSAAMKLISYVREAILLISLAIHVEEQSKGTDVLVMPMYLDVYKDDWKY
ncbi:LA2681 family HEPN domain-containing protein [Lysinibacillus sphaericus]|uniref:LA2681 family HEPN domain-containing protein n=1 Tax=Lysinibacillus sphaericus TaxID=1421 RepID=UPI003D06EFD6